MDITGIYVFTFFSNAYCFKSCRGPYGRPFGCFSRLRLSWKHTWQWWYFTRRLLDHQHFELWYKLIYPRYYLIRVLLRCDGRHTFSYFCFVICFMFIWKLCDMQYDIHVLPHSMCSQSWWWKLQLVNDKYAWFLRFRKNITWYTMHTIVSRPNPNHWIMIHISIINNTSHGYVFVQTVSQDIWAKLKGCPCKNRLSTPFWIVSLILWYKFLHCERAAIGSDHLCANSSYIWNAFPFYSSDQD